MQGLEVIFAGGALLLAHGSLEIVVICLGGEFFDDGGPSGFGHKQPISIVSVRGFQNFGPGSSPGNRSSKFSKCLRTRARIIIRLESTG